MTVSDRTRPWIWTYFTECKRAPHPPGASASYAVYPPSTSNDTLRRILKLQYPRWYLSTILGLLDLPSPLDENQVISELISEVISLVIPEGRLR
jgi:hypothetical protein